MGRTAKKNPVKRGLKPGDSLISLKSPSQGGKIGETIKMSLIKSVLNINSSPDISFITFISNFYDFCK